MISIIIVNYHVKKELFACISSIYSSKPKSAFEIIVVDNDETKTIKKELKKKFPKVFYIVNDNKGFGQGNNIGAKHAKGEYLFFLNPDTVVAKNSIDILVEYLNTHKKIGIAAPLLTDLSGNLIQLQGARKLTPFSAIFSFSMISKLFPDNLMAKKYWYKNEWNKKTIYNVESVPGTAFVIRKKIFDDIQGFDRNFFLYFEEHDLCKRVRGLGWIITMHPGARVAHALGASTKQSKKDSNKIFKESRFYYFKKHYGLLSAILTEAIMRFSKYTALLLFFIILGFILRTYNIHNSMEFIGDQGWFYLSARDILLTTQVPLVGIASSHPWIHQGALWTYMLAFGLWFMKFSPFAGVYLSVIIDLTAIFFIYKLGKVIISRRVGLIAAVLYAVSPLIIVNARMPYHTSPIPFFTILVLYCLYKFIGGNKYYFPILIALLALLYNFELASFLLIITIAIIFLSGVIRKQKWAIGVLNKDIFLLSIISFILPMLPMLVYDFSHGFPQTLKFLMWIGYRVMVFFGYPPINPIPPVSIGEMTSFMIGKWSMLIMPYFSSISAFFLLGGLLFLLIQVFKNRKYKVYLILLTVNIFLICGLFVVRTPSDAYLPLLFPGLILMTAILFDGIIGNKMKIIKFSGIIVLVEVAIFNSYFVLNSYFYNNSFLKKIQAAKYIVKTVGEKEYNLKGVGPGSKFESFTMNYEYLTWWLGHGPSKKKQPLTFVISENNNEVIVYKAVINIK